MKIIKTSVQTLKTYECKLCAFLKIQHIISWIKAKIELSSQLFEWLMFNLIQHNPKYNGN